MKELTKARGMSPNEIRWTLSMKSLDGRHTWHHILDLGSLWDFTQSFEKMMENNPETMAWSKAGWDLARVEHEEFYPVAREMLESQNALWDGRTGAIYLSTGSVTTSHETKEGFYAEVESFLEYCLSTRKGDFAFVTLTIQTAGQSTRSHKWQVMVTAEEIAVLVGAVHAEF